MIISRRAVLGLMPVMPAALQAVAQGPAPAPARLRRLIEAGAGYYMLEPDGRVKVWTGSQNVTGATLGFDHNRPVTRYVAEDHPVLKGATTIASGGVGCAVMADGRVLAWGSNWNGLLGNTPRAELEATAQAHPPVPMPTPKSRASTGSIGSVTRVPAAAPNAATDSATMASVGTAPESGSETTFTQEVGSETTFTQESATAVAWGCANVRKIVSDPIFRRGTGAACAGACRWPRRARWRRPGRSAAGRARRRRSVARSTPRCAPRPSASR